MASDLHDLQRIIQCDAAFPELDAFLSLALAYLGYLQEVHPTRIVSPKEPNYMFYQYGGEHQHAITRPLNAHLFMTSPETLAAMYARFLAFLDELHQFQEASAAQPSVQAYLQTDDLNKVIYTLQQTVGCIGDSFTNANQSRKRIGQIFETLITLIMQRIGITCAKRTIKVPIPGYPGLHMPYELDIVFSRKGVITSEVTTALHPLEIVGSVKTTSKDRIDKVFLDKFLLSKLLERDIPVVAIFLHDIQRASTPEKRKSAPGATNFGIAPTFKTNHFLGYTVALNRLDGVFYIDPRPEMLTRPDLRDQIHDFRQFLATDVWLLSQRLQAIAGEESSRSDDALE